MATILQSHHALEKDLFKTHPLLKAMAGNDPPLIDKDASNNRIYLPYEKDFADQIDAAPHRGKTDSSYTKYFSDKHFTRRLLPKVEVPRLEIGTNPKPPSGRPS